MPRLEKSQLVARVLNRLSSPERWATGVGASRHPASHPEAWHGVAELGIVDPRSAEAVSWCTGGAITRELYDAGREMCGEEFVPDHLTRELRQEIVEVFREQYPELHEVCIAGFNDHPNMDLAGIRAVLEKVHVKLLERGE